MFPVFMIMHGTMNTMTVRWYNICDVKLAILGPTLMPVGPVTTR